MWQFRSEGNLGFNGAEVSTLQSLGVELTTTTMCLAWTRFVGEKLFGDGMLAVTRLHNHTLKLSYF